MKISIVASSLRRQVAAAAVVGALVLAGSAARPAAQAPWNGSYFPNIELTTQDGKKIHFYDEIKGDKTVAIELMYTSCKYACPLETARMAEVYKLLADRMGKDIFFYSISIDPQHDTPAVLKEYSKKYKTGPGWTFLTGKEDDIEKLSKKLGLYSPPDPENPDGHVPTLLIGNEAAGQWTRGSALDNPRMSATMIGNWMGGYNNPLPFKTVKNGDALKNFDTAAYLFSTKCSACHTLGGGSKVGPDLAGVTARRTKQWLAKYIAGPEAMLKAGDPIAKSLAAKYKMMQMPDLQLSPEQIQNLLGYLDRAGRAQHETQSAPKR